MDSLIAADQIMSNLWPWLAIGGFGALHGLNPATGWMLAAGWGLRSGHRVQALRALAPIAIGHVLSIAIVAVVVGLGLSKDRFVMQVVAGGLLVVVAVCHLAGRKATQVCMPTGHAGLALWSFMMSTAHGAGSMLVPALIPLCAGNGPGHEILTSGPLTLALAAVGVHTVAMLAVTGLVASGVCRGFDVGTRLLQGLKRKSPSAPLKSR